MQNTKSRPPTLEELIPQDPPHTVIEGSVKTARVRFKVDYWPITKLTKGERLYGGQVELLPIKEAKHVVENKIGELTFDDIDEEEKPLEYKSYAREKK